MVGGSQAADVATRDAEPRRERAASGATQGLMADVARLQRTLGNRAVARASVIDAYGDAARGPGGEVPFRGEMERSFGADFSRVRAVTGRQIQLLPLNARAATRGEEVVFGDERPDRSLVAHELTHVLQNRRAGGRTSGGVSRHGDAAEVEARAIAGGAARAGSGSATPTAEISLATLTESDKLKISMTLTERLFDDRVGGTYRLMGVTPTQIDSLRDALLAEFGRDEQDKEYIRSEVVKAAARAETLPLAPVTAAASNANAAADAAAAASAAALASLARDGHGAAAPASAAAHVASTASNSSSSAAATVAATAPSAQTARDAVLLGGARDALHGIVDFVMSGNSWIGIGTLVTAFKNLPYSRQRMHANIDRQGLPGLTSIIQAIGVQFATKKLTPAALNDALGGPEEVTVTGVGSVLDAFQDVANTAGSIAADASAGALSSGTGVGVVTAVAQSAYEAGTRSLDFGALCGQMLPYLEGDALRIVKAKGRENWGCVIL